MRIVFTTTQGDIVISLLLKLNHGSNKSLYNKDILKKLLKIKLLILTNKNWD